MLKLCQPPRQDGMGECYCPLMHPAWLRAVETFSSTVMSTAIRKASVSMAYALQCICRGTPSMPPCSGWLTSPLEQRLKGWWRFP